MTKRILLASFLILVVWVAADALMHNYLLAPFYLQNTAIWRPLNQMNVALVFLVRFVLLGTFVATYVWLVRPRTFATGISFGALTGLTLGIAVGLGTYIHSPISVALAWAWFAAAVFKSIAAGAIVGLLLREKPRNA